jgi:hypothetical protein
VKIYVLAAVLAEREARRTAFRAGVLAKSGRAAGRGVAETPGSPVMACVAGLPESAREGSGIMKTEEFSNVAFGEDTPATHTERANVFRSAPDSRHSIC